MVCNRNPNNMIFYGSSRKSMMTNVTYLLMSFISVFVVSTFNLQESYSFTFSSPKYATKIGRVTLSDGICRLMVRSMINDNIQDENEGIEKNRSMKKPINDYVVPYNFDGNIPISSSKNNGYSSSSNTPQSYSVLLSKRGTVFDRLSRKLGIRNSRNDAMDNDDNEDGWSDLRKENPSLLKSVVNVFPRLKITWRAIFPKPPIEPGTLILVRHGESVWNANKTFTGWSDPDLSERGYREIEHAARLILEGGYKIDVVFTSRLKRAIRSVWIILEEMDQVYLPVFKSWRLNERMYGALTGLSKIETAEKLGAVKVQEWRGSLHSRPPPVSTTSPFWPGRDRKYADLTVDQIPLTESLSDSMKRCGPLWNNKIMYELRNGKNVMVVAHANTLRGLVKTIDDVSDDAIREVAIPTGIPIVYKFDECMKPIPPSGDRQTASQIHMKGLFLEKPGLLKEALKREEEWSRLVPGYNETIAQSNAKVPVMTSLERSLFKLQASRELGEWAGQFIDPNEQEDDGNDGNMGRPIQIVPVDETDDDTSVRVPGLSNSESYLRNGFLDDEEDVYSVGNGDSNKEQVTANIISNQPCVKSIPKENGRPIIDSLVSNLPKRQDAVIVIIRHGKTDHNKLGLFTGWEDAPLAQEGVDEAREAGRLLKVHGFEFDVVYTSWLSRAIETAWHVIDEMDSLWLPIVKTWRLNERMYGELTGLSKQMVKQRHGDKQFKAWRRGFSTPPPKVSSFSQHYPGNDPRYQKYLKDVRYSARESLIRSIEKGRPELHRKLPKSESLKDCMARTVPYFTDRIVPEAISQGKRVLISSSENAIRGLLMHLCDIPESEITGLEIPNGLPIIFDWKNKCVKLLDDGSGRDPLEVHNFGKAANYLFRPCANEDGSPDEECDILFGNDQPVQLTAEEQAAIDAIINKKALTAA